MSSQFRSVVIIAVWAGLSLAACAQDVDSAEEETPVAGVSQSALSFEWKAMDASGSVSKSGRIDGNVLSSCINDYCEMGVAPPARFSCTACTGLPPQYWEFGLPIVAQRTCEGDVLGKIAAGIEPFSPDLVTEGIVGPGDFVYCISNSRDYERIELELVADPDKRILA